MGESARGRAQGDEVRWRRPSRCQTGECLEVQRQGDLVIVRDSTSPGTIVRLDIASWRAFAEAIKAGEYDDLA